MEIVGTYQRCDAQLVSAVVELLSKRAVFMSVSEYSLLIEWGPENSPVYDHVPHSAERKWKDRGVTPRERTDG